MNINLNGVRAVPRAGGPYFLSDGGMETTLVFHNGIDLPNFAAFVLIDTSEGVAALWDYYDRYLTMASQFGVNFILESPTWRANPDWGAQMNLTRSLLHDVNRDCMKLMHEVRDQYETKSMQIAISGCIGPRGDGYVAGQQMTLAEARNYHGWQIEVLKNTGADFVTAMTMTNSNEAAGVAVAAKEAGIDSVISFTVETDGRLPSGETLKDAILQVEWLSDCAPLYYMINCAHPTHFDAVLPPHAEWTTRIGGIRANASRCSHEELDNATELDSGDPAELGQLYRNLLTRFPHISVLGGCCGTDHRHVGEIARACLPTHCKADFETVD